MAARVPPTTVDYEFIAGAVKAATTEAGAKGSDLWMVPLEHIHVLKGFNIRITGTEAYESKIAELQHSIATEGFYRDKPLVGYVGKADDNKTNIIMLTDGHRRLEALRRAIKAGGLDIPRVPVIIKPQGTDAADLTVAMMKTGEPLTPYEQAIGIKRLVSFMIPVGDIAKRLGMTKNWVDDLLLLIGGPQKIRELVIENKVAATLAIEQIKSDPANAASILAETVAAEPNKKRITAKDVKKTKAKKAAAAPPPVTKKAKAAAEKETKEALKLEYEFQGKAGETYPLTAIAQFVGVAGGTWYTLTETDGEIALVQDIRLKLTMSRKPAPAPLPASLAAESEGL